MSGSDLLKVLKDMLKDVLKGETNRTVDPHVGRDPKDLSPLSTTRQQGSVAWTLSSHSSHYRHRANRTRPMKNSRGGNSLTSLFDYVPLSSHLKCIFTALFGDYQFL